MIHTFLHIFPYPKIRQFNLHPPILQSFYYYTHYYVFNPFLKLTSKNVQIYKLQPSKQSGYIFNPPFLRPYIHIIISHPSIHPPSFLHPHVCTANWNTVNGRYLLRVSATTSCQMTVEWRVSLAKCSSYTVLISVVKMLYSFFLITMTTHCYYCFYGSCFKHDYPNLFSQKQKKTSKNKLYKSLSICTRKAYSLVY